MTSTPKTATLFPYMFALLLLILSAYILTVSFIPYSTLRDQLQALTLFGHANVFTEGFHHRVVILLRVVAAAPIVIAALVLFFRRRIAILVGSTVGSVTTFLAETTREAADALGKESQLHRLLLATTLLLTLWVRLLFLFQPMRYDEAYTFTHFASTPLYLVVSNYSSTNNHIFHTILVHFSFLLFGNHPWALRLPVLIAGWLLVPSTYLVARTFFNRQAALLAALLVASSSPLIEYSTNARGYDLMTLFFLLLLGLAPYCLRSSSPAPWILFSVISALGFYTLPTMLYAFGIVAGWVLLMALLREAPAGRLAVVRRLVVASAGGAALTLLLYSPVLMVWGTNMRNQDVLPQPWEHLASGLLPAALSAWQQWNYALAEPIAVLLAFGFMVALVFHTRVARHRVPIAPVALLWIALAILAQRVVPYGRVWIFLLPLYLILASAGLAFLWNVVTSANVGSWSGAFGLVSLALGLALSWNVASTQAVLYSDEGASLRDAEAISAWMKDHLTTGDVVLAVTPAGGILQYYFPVYNLRAADYWYSTQLHGPQLEPGRRLLAVVKDAGPDLPAMLKEAGLTPSGLSSPELVRRFPETSIYQMVAASP